MSRLEMHSVNSVDDHDLRWFMSFGTMAASFSDCILCLVLGNSPWLSVQVFQHFWLLLTELSVSHWFSCFEHFCSPTGKAGKVEEDATKRHDFMVLIPLKLQASPKDNYIAFDHYILLGTYTTFQMYAVSTIFFFLN